MSGESILQVTAPIAVTIGKYLYAAVKKWWDKRDENEAVKKNEVAIANLMKETEVLKNKLESKDRKEIGSDDVTLVEQKMVEVKALGDTMKEDVTSMRAIATWADDNIQAAKGSDVEDLAEFYKYRLRNLIDRADELMLKRSKKEELQMLLVSIDVNVGRFLEAGKIAKVRSTVENRDAYVDTEYTLKDTLEYARDSLRQLG